MQQGVLSLIGNRAYLAAIERTVNLMYVGTETNYSNVNMAFVAAWGVLRYETDPVIQRAMLSILEARLYAPGADREVINCDAAELASRACVGVDGTALPIAATLGRGGSPVAIDPVPMRIRPPSNFVHRSDPHGVNGGGGSRLNPAGSMHAAYWMGRLLEASSDPRANVSPRARPPLAWTPRSTPDAGSAPPDGGTEPPASAGCGCRVGSPGAEPNAMVALGAMMLLAALRRRR